jgi:hypothetical protein
MGVSGNDNIRKNPINNDKNPSIAPMSLYPRKLNPTEHIDINIAKSSIKDTKIAKDAIKILIICLN